MKMRLTVAGIALLVMLPVQQASAQSNEEEFQQIVAYLKANDAERETAIATCIEQGIGDNPTGVAKLIGVPVDEATAAWCTRTTNGIAGGKLTLADLQAANEGEITPNMRKVLTEKP